ncbi:hypothetical protein BP6252_12753 [Coleophoma cylindrospora]|uniref:Uncharacterized protein n=1 Tax=Coleophoma cylindrospora TaxID=1849047 RepID=A0A3D8QCT9_9HELO|nr:hypothetical protein BP6252_12753 [Coleophoma cylindrospora]
MCLLVGGGSIPTLQVLVDGTVMPCPSWDAPSRGRGRKAAWKWMAHRELVLMLRTYSIDAGACVSRPECRIRSHADDQVARCKYRPTVVKESRPARANEEARRPVRQARSFTWRPEWASRHGRIAFRGHPEHIDVKRIIGLDSDPPAFSGTFVAWKDVIAGGPWPMRTRPPSRHARRQSEEKAVQRAPWMCVAFIVAHPTTHGVARTDKTYR